MAIMGHQIGQQLCDALGQPPRTRSFVLRCAVGEAVTVVCEYYPADNPQHPLKPAFAEYELVRRDVKPAPVHFDTWMRARREAAHAAMLARDARLAAIDRKIATCHA
jgi:hypothetical protein